MPTVKKSLPVTPKSVLWNPSFDQLGELIGKMPNAKWTEFGNYNVQTKVVARSKASTYVVTDHPENHSDQTIKREEGRRVAELQDAYIREQEMIVIEGFIGNDPKYRVSARLIIEASNANIAAMQKTLYFTPTEKELESFEPKLQVIYTPNLKMEGYPNDRLIAVDLDQYVTRVFNSDYFGESKKGGLRMWNQLIYQQSGLALHAGCKVIPVGDKKRVGMIVGLSGTGKTTTTFTTQNGSQPVQDDFVAWMPDGKVVATENGCFAKTFGLDPKYEPTIHKAVTCADSFLENVSQNGEKIDFFDTSHTQNGRAVFGMDKVDGAGDARELDRADFLLILNRNENIIPAVARLNPEQAAAYFMLGETKGTSAGGAEEAGKNLRVPGTNPFFPLLHGFQGNRFLELMSKNQIDVYVMNTGRVGGPDGDDRSMKVRIPHSSAVVKGIAEGTIEWTKDPDFGYEIATKVPGIEASDEGLLRPRALYEKQGRQDEYQSFVDRFKKERVAHLGTFPNLEEKILAAVR